MSKKKYSDLLKTDQWKRKRLRILKRDRFTCVQCGSKENLQVHHLWYPPGKKPWEIDDKYLQTLCRKCHEGEHNLHPINGFRKKPTITMEKGKKRKKVKNGTPRKKKNFNMTKKDKLIQDRYNNLRIKGLIP